MPGIALSVTPIVIRDYYSLTFFSNPFSASSAWYFDRHLNMLTITNRCTPILSKPPHHLIFSATHIPPWASVNSLNPFNSVNSDFLGLFLLPFGLPRLTATGRLSSFFTTPFPTSFPYPGPIP